MAQKLHIMTTSFWQNTSKVTWEATPSPWRPSKKDICIFAAYIFLFLKTKRMPRVLLIGATRELRAILSFFKIPYDLVDYSANMITLSTPQNDSSLGAIYLQDWMSPVPTKNKYDVILGDLILNLIKKEHIQKFFLTHNKHLATGGKYFIRGRYCADFPVEKIISVVSRQLRAIDTKSLYVIFANFQRLEQCDKATADKLLAECVESEHDPQKSALLALLRDKFIHSELQYTIHSKNFIRKTVPNTSFSFSQHPKNYLDFFAFTTVKPHLHL